MPNAQEILAALEASLTELEKASPWAKVMIYGDSGVGKTVGTMEIAQKITPSDQQIILVDSKEGWTSLINHPELKRRVKRIPWQGIVQAEYLVAAVRQGAGSFANTGCLIWDEVSSMAGQDLDVVLAAKSAEDSSKDPDVPTQPDMNANTERMRRFLWEALDLPLHQFYIAHQRIDEDHQKIRVTSPDFMPKLSKRMREPMHVVAHATGSDKVIGAQQVYTRALQVHPTRLVIAKSRVGGLNRTAEWGEFGSRLKSWLGSDEVMLPNVEDNTVATPVAAATTDDVTPFEGIEV